MCGITGFLGPVTRGEELAASLGRMTSTLTHRGPDDAGSWVDETAGIALGHRRLSIIDLSAEGHQPMHSACGRYVTVYNGEIYNFRSIRTTLEGDGHRFRGHSDTEVMLAAISAWGLARALPHFNGMFAFALWDRRDRRLHLVRDRLGEKPLYYGRAGATLLFGSELKAIRAHPAFRGEIDRQALDLYLRHGYVPSPFSIYGGIFKLPAGTSVCFAQAEPAAGVPVPYWSARQVAEEGVANRFSVPESQLVDDLDELLRDAVRLRMEADVPLGAFLSGGIDSSAVVALMQAQSDRPVKTFTIGFSEASHNEAEDARRVARHLGTDHSDLYVSPAEALAVVPRLPTLYDEPFADSSQVPTFLVAALARREVTVSLSGDGGDELFGGYNRHLWAAGAGGRVARLPRPVKRAAASLLRAVPPDRWEAALETLRPLLPRRLVHRNAGEKLQKLADTLTAADDREVYSRLTTRGATGVVIGDPAPVGREPSAVWANLEGFAEQMMYLDSILYMPDDILVKVDRATMGVSLEGRIPFLDPRVFEFAWRLPLHMKIRDGRGKHILRQVLHRYVPQELVDRPKAGFAVPIDQWLRGPLREWAEELLSEDRLRRDGLLDARAVRTRWKEHLAGTRNWQHHLWDVLMLQAWLTEASQPIASEASKPLAVA